MKTKTTKPLKGEDILAPYFKGNTSPKTPIQGEDIFRNIPWANLNHAAQPGSVPIYLTPELLEDHIAHIESVLQNSKKRGEFFQSELYYNNKAQTNLRKIRQVLIEARPGKDEEKEAKK